MASKAGMKKKAAQEKTRPLADRVADAALKIAARDGWHHVKAAQVAAEIAEPLGKIISHYPAPSDIASLLVRRVNDTVLSNVKAVDETDSPRDRLFEVLMMRLDTLQASRDGYSAVLRGLVGNPPSFVCAAPAIAHSMTLMLTAAGINAAGPFGLVRAHALALAYASVLRVWVKDDTADLGPTMAAMDETLGRLERLASMSALKGWRKVRDREPSPADT